MRTMRPPGPFTEGLIGFTGLLPPNCVMAEIGVYAGEASRIFLAKAKVLYCIDPWQNYVERNAGRIDTLNDADWAEAQFDKLANDHPDIIVKMKMTSGCASFIIPDGSLDAAYVDANHEYRHCRADLERWKRKVKPKGILAGHDYEHGPREGVKQAVLETVGEPQWVFSDHTWAVQLD